MMKPALSMDRLAAVYGRVARRYDIQHRVLTMGSDERGRQLVVRRAVGRGDAVLDCGAGTGSTSVLAADATGREGWVVLYDMSEEMLTVARPKMNAAPCDVSFEVGDMCALPFAENSFDVALSTYSLCPLYDPREGALELYRVVKPGGKIGIAHSAEPDNPLVRGMAAAVESIVWRLPSVSLGCRAISVLPTLEEAGGRVTFRTRIGVPLWPFAVIVVQKPEPD